MNIWTRMLIQTLSKKLQETQLMKKSQLLKNLNPKKMKREKVKSTLDTLHMKIQVVILQTNSAGSLLFVNIQAFMH